MARTELSKVVAPGSYAHTGAQLTKEAADTSNLNSFKATGKELVIAHNTGASPYTVTVSSVNDPYNRTQDIDAYSIPAGEIHFFGPFDLTGWQQSDGHIYLQAENSAVEFGIIKL